MSLRALTRFVGVCGFLLIALAPITRAQVTTTWTGLGGDNLWTDPGNWDPSVPGSLDTAQFIDTGNGVNSISLGAAAQPLSTLSFSSTPASYTIGVLSSGDLLNLSASGAITLTSSVANPQAINAAISTAGAAAITNSTTSSAGALTINGNMTLGGALTLSGATGSQVNLNGVIGGTGSVSVASTDTGTVRFANANTYNGGTTLTGTGAIIQIGASTVGTPGSVTSGPFGTGTILFNNATPSILEPVGGDRVIDNSLSLTNGFFTQSATGDAGHNLTFTASMTLGKVVTNNMSSGELIFGTPGTSSTMAPGGGTLQSQPAASGPNGGVTIINDQMIGTGTLAIKQAGTVYINNATNTNTGNVTVLGIATGASGVVGEGGTLAGTGKISNGGTVTISATAVGNTQGGIISPGSAPSTPGTLSTGGAMAWDPVGRYVFDYDGNNNATGGGTNDLVTITGNINLANLGSGKLFDIDLNPTTLTASATPLSYVIATTGGTINNSISTAAGTDLTTLFSFSGSYSGTPTAAIGSDDKSIVVTFTPLAVPEPGCLALLGLAGIAGLRRRR